MAAGGAAAPKTADLDGIETTSTRDGTVILFDHDADGVKTGTGWVKPDDGWLVLDRNGNGTIDSGRELFGVDTRKSNGQLATDGFDALKDLEWGCALANTSGRLIWTLVRRAQAPWPASSGFVSLTAQAVDMA